MAIETEKLVREFMAMSLPDSEDASLAQLHSGEGYWELRRQAVTAILGDTALSSGDRVEQILKSEVLMSAEWQTHIYLRSKRLAVEAAALDLHLHPAERFQLLAQVETGQRTVSGFVSHIDVIKSLLEKTSEHTEDGLVMRLDFTDPEPNMTYPHRKFVGATVHKFDLQKLGVWVFDRHPVNEPYTATSRSFSNDSGLHFRYAPEVLDWQKAHGIPEAQSCRVYGIYSAAEDKRTWVRFGGSGWSGSEYPDVGPAMLWGQQEVAEFLARMMTYGGERLAKIQADIGDYPGFEFIHDIQASGELGADSHSLAANQPA